MPVHPPHDEDIGRISHFRAECRANVNPTEELTETETYELGPPGGQSTVWPDLMFTRPPVTHCVALAVRNFTHNMHTTRADGTMHVDVTTGQKEYKHDFLEAVPKETAQATTTQAPDP